ncbi:MAG: glycoside hydrolase family 99-like domain-containing protein [Nitrososphaerota archaeon]|nr:glycoside hydrolase family 99-like domain-containing protein [Nitrososphaerota archaeon]
MFLLFQPTPKASPSIPQVTSGEPYTIGAWYFTAWNDINDFQAVNSYGLYGRYDPWGGVRDYALGGDPQHLGVNYSNRQPLLGFYDLLDQSIMDTQILQAASRGLSYFAFYYYWDTDHNRESNVSVPIQRFVTSPNKGLMKFLISPFPVGRAPMTLSMWDNSVVPYMVTHYISDPSYLRTTDGRPVYVDFGWWQNDTQHAASLAYLRNATMAATGKNPIILFVAQQAHTVGDLTYAQSHLNLDGFTCFTFGPDYPGQPYSQKLAQIVPTFERQNMSFYVPCTTMGEDQRPWWDVGEGWGLQPNQMPYFSNITFTGFQQNLMDLKTYMNGNVTRTSKMLIVYAWNEWGEGGHIEPDAVYGYKYLDIIQSVFGLTPNAAQPATGKNGAVMVNWQAPKMMTTGGAAVAQVTVKNTGSSTWTSSGGYQLSSQNPQDNGVWGTSRVSLDSEQTVAPGKQIVFSFSVVAPSQPGTYNFRWRMIQNGSGPFGDYTTTVKVTVVQGAAATTTTTATSTSTSTTTNAVPSATTTSQTSVATSTSSSVFTPTQTTTSNAAQTTSTSTSSGGILEFPAQPLVAAAFAFLMVAAYLRARAKTRPDNEGTLLR